MPNKFVCYFPGVVTNKDNQPLI